MKYSQMLGPFPPSFTAPSICNIQYPQIQRNLAVVLRIENLYIKCVNDEYFLDIYIYRYTCAAEVDTPKTKSLGESDLLILSSSEFVGSFLDTTNSSSAHFTDKKKKQSTRDI